MHVHFLGIGGTLMGNLALLARDLGEQVTGSDSRLYPPMSEVLAASGIPVESDWGEDALSRRPDLVVIGNAKLPRGHPSVERVLREGLDYTSGAEWLGRSVLRGRHVIAVSGTHGKTTTTAMLAHVLRGAGLDPGWLVAGAPLDLPGPSALGAAGAPFVVEADEYDTSYFDRRSKFLHYRPRTLVINNLEYDHADIFPDLAAIQQQFALLLRTVPDDGLVITPVGDANVEAVIETGLWSPRTRFGLSGTADASRCDWSAESAPDGSRFTVRSPAGERLGDVVWTLIGQHNVRNGLAAVAAAAAVGVAPDRSCALLSRFRGVKRRLEQLGTRGGVTVYEDFAHHPTAIRTTLQGLRARVGNERILAVIDPATHTMSLGTLRAALRDSVADADEVLWYANPALRWDVGALLDGSPVPARSAATVDEIVAGLLEAAGLPATRQHVVIMSNGAFGGLPEALRAHFPTETDDDSNRQDRRDAP